MVGLNGRREAGDEVQARGPPFVWQTAYQLKAMMLAQKYVSVDHAQMLKTQNWLKSECAASGEHIEKYPFPIYSTGTNAYLTSYVHTILSEAGQINQATDKWLEATFDKLTHPLDIMSTCYALHVIKSEKKESCYNKIEHMMRNDSSGYFWADLENKPDIHLTSYGLMILTERKSYSKGLEVFKFILARVQAPLDHTNAGANAGNAVANWMVDSYIKTIYSEALSKFLTLTKRYNPAIENVFINFNIDGKQNQIHLRPMTDIVEVIEVNSSAQNIEITAQGFGRAKARIDYVFNVDKFKQGHFNTNVTVEEQNNSYRLLTICTR